MIICWWSGGVTSAVACKLAIELYGPEKCMVVMIDTKNEDMDTYRFKKDCSVWYGKEITSITGIYNPMDTDSVYVDVGMHKSIQDVWDTYKSLNVATGAICSTILKRTVREKWQKTVDFEYQVFGYEFDKKEFNRAKSMTLNHSDSKGIYPLLMFGYDKDDCIRVLNNAGIKIPVTYSMGFRNNNCFNTGCVQGGIGYWQKMKRDRPDVFDRMSEVEHRLTDMKGQPVTMLKDQSKYAKQSGNVLVFLKKHPEYPDLKSIDEMPECKVEPLQECNGFCGTNDLIERNETESQINFSDGDYTQTELNF